MLRGELIHQKTFIDEKNMQMEYDKTARRLGPNINKYTPVSPANRKSSLADLLFDNQSNLVNLHCGHLSSVHPQWF